MNDRDVDPLDDRKRIGWWLFIITLALVAAIIAYEFVGILVLGVFGYYATRPINDRLAAVIDSDDLAAWATVLVVLLPLLLLILYAGFQVALQAQELLGNGGFFVQGFLDALPVEQRNALQSILENPGQYVADPQRLLELLTTLSSAASVFFRVQLVLALGITLTAFLLANDDALASGFRQLVGGSGTTAYAYAAALDADFESVWFGNFLFVLLMALVATIVYWGTNVFAPAGLHVPMVLVLGFLTGVASLIPLVVGKIVYMPVVAVLGLQAARADGTPYVFVGIVFVVYFFVLDFLPQTFIQPYITGRQLDTVMMMFGYLLGPILFGWYGLFLLPMIFIVILEAIRIVVPNLVRGEPLTTGVEMGETVGTTPRDKRRGVPDEDEASHTDGDASDGPTDSSESGSDTSGT